MGKNYRVEISLIIIGLLTILVGCTKNNPTPAISDKEQEESGETIYLNKEKKEIVGIETTKAQIKKIKTKVSALGNITYNERRLSHITSRISGRIEEVFAFLQSKVKTDEPLLSLYSPEYLTSQSEYIQAEERFKRAKQMGDKEEEITAKAIYESARRKLEILGVNEEELSKLEKTHIPQSYLTIRAPFFGTIIENNAVQGNYIEQGSNLYKLADLTTLWVIADVYEKDIAQVETGEIAEIHATAYPDKIFTGNVAVIGDVLDEKTRTFKVRIEVKNLEGKLKPGMFVNVLIESKSFIEALVIPASAIQTDEGKEIVFVEKNPNTYIKREIRTGLISEGFVQILDGINTGVKVVSKGSFILKSELLKNELEGE